MIQTTIKTDQKIEKVCKHTSNTASYPNFIGKILCQLYRHAKYILTKWGTNSTKITRTKISIVSVNTIHRTNFSSIFSTNITTINSVLMDTISFVATARTMWMTT